MANFISKMTVNGSDYEFHDSEFIEDNRLSGGAALTGISKATELFNGMQITYWLNYASDTDATLNLTLANGTTTGPIPCYYSGAIRLSIQYPPGNIIHFTYRVNPQVDGNVLPSGWWANINYDASAETDLVGNPIIIPDAEAGSSVDINTSATYIFHSSSINLIDPTWTNQSTHTLREFGKITEDGTAVSSAALYGTATVPLNEVLPAGTYYFYFDRGNLPAGGTGKLEYAVDGTNYTINENTSFTVNTNFTLRRIYLSTTVAIGANKIYTYSIQLERGSALSEYSVPTVAPVYLTPIVSPVTVANFEGYNYYFANDLMTIISNSIINDNVATSKTTYSSNKIESLLNSKVPDPPDTNGTYTLTATVLNGVKTYAWVLNT